MKRLTFLLIISLQLGSFLSLAQNVGFGVTDPAFMIDIAGQMRFRSNNPNANSSGIFWNNQANTLQRVFLGMSSPDSAFAIYSPHLNKYIVEFELMREPRLGINTRHGGDGLVRSELHVMHTNSGGSNDGVRIQNEGTNAQFWNLYTSNSTGNFEFYKQGIRRAIIDPASGAYASVSDRRLKKNISMVGSGVLGKVMQLQTHRYQYTDLIDEESGLAYPDKHFHYGFMAQDVKQLFPELVFGGSDNPKQDFLTLNYAGFSVIAIKAIQEQQQQIESLKQQNEALNRRLERLENLVSGDPTKARE